jgi:hypothetical protein
MSRDVAALAAARRLEPDRGDEGPARGHHVRRRADDQPDGGELNRRQNDFPWPEFEETFEHLAGAPPTWYYSTRAGGFDVNREFHPDLTYEPRAADLPGADALPGFYLRQKARTLRALYLELRAEFGAVDAYVDLHHMGPCEQIEGDGDYVTVSLD